MKNIVLNNNTYTVEFNYKDCINVDELKSLFTDYFDEFDYVFGDYSYNKLRLKGFYNTNNKKVKKYNDIAGYKKYLDEYCANDCAWFLIKKQK